MRTCGNRLRTLVTPAAEVMGGNVISELLAQWEESARRGILDVRLIPDARQIRQRPDRVDVP
jgi:hypothetical protein